MTLFYEVFCFWFELHYLTFEEESWKVDLSITHRLSILFK